MIWSIVEDFHEHNFTVIITNSQLLISTILASELTRKQEELKPMSKSSINKLTIQ